MPTFKQFFVQMRLKTDYISTEDATKKLFAAFEPGEITELEIDGEKE